MSPDVERGLGTADAVVLGLASMLGTGVYAVWGTAAAAAGGATVLAVVLAGIVALCCAASSADLAVAHPRAGAGYRYGSARLCPGAGRLAGVAFLVAKATSAAAAAEVFGSYVLPSAPLVAALLALVAVTALDVAGVRWTARNAYALVGGTLAVLLVVVAVGLTGRGGAVDPAAPVVAPIVGERGFLGGLTAAGLIFFAFAGFGRIAALGEEVRDPRRTLRWAVALASGVALVIYVLVAWALLVGLGPDRLAGQLAPLAALVDTRGAPGLGVLVRVGAAVATGAALLSALGGLARMAAAMAQARDVPRVFARVGRRGTPWVADLAGAAVAAGVAVVAGPAAAIAVSACSLLIYYGVVNLAALRLPSSARAWPRSMSVAGVVLCLVLALLLPFAEVLVTAAALAVGWTACTFLPHRW